MIVSSLVGLSLVLNVALDNRTAFAIAPPAVSELSTQQKGATLMPLVQRATACIVRKVSADRRHGDLSQPEQINDLIVDSISACARPVRAMIDMHDRLYGAGSGEAFLLGPYLDVLPSAVIRQVKFRTP